MAYFYSLLVLAQTLLFLVTDLNAKKLEERGFSAGMVFYLQRYAVLPMGLLVLWTYKPEYGAAILASPFLIFFFLITGFLFTIQQYVTYFLLKSVENVSFMEAFTSLIRLPIYLCLGMLINHDMPNLWVGVSFACLTLALMLKPALSESHKQQGVFTTKTWVVICVAFLGITLDGINNAWYREALNQIDSTLFVLGLSCFINMILPTIYFLFRKAPEKDLALIKSHPVLAYSIPLFWFLASIPEGYTVANIPIYTTIAIGSIAFLIDIGSDIINDRITWNKQTLVFAFLVLLSIVFSVFSL